MVDRCLILYALCFAYGLSECSGESLSERYQELLWTDWGQKPVGSASAIPAPLEEEDHVVKRFKQLGYSGSGVPSDLSAFVPHLLHEESVVQYVDPLQNFRFLDRGSHAAIFLGELRESGRKVIIKQFDDTSLEDLVVEPQIMAYLGDTGFVPQFHGLLPTGSDVANFSLVLDFLQNTQNLEDLMMSSANVSPRQYLAIAWQLASALLTLHQRYVLFNDVHRRNVLVRWRGTEPIVFLIDFGLASFREGQRLQSFSRTETSFDFIAPEVKWHRLSTSPESDVFALGYVLDTINAKVNDTHLSQLARACQREEPIFRPVLADIVTTLYSLRQRYATREDWTGKEYSEEVDEEMEDFTREPLAVIEPQLLSPNPIEDENLFQSEDPEVQQSLWIERHKTWNISTATLLTTDEEVWVISSAIDGFELTRNEAAVMRYLDDTGYVLHVLGLTWADDNLERMSLVTESFMPSVSLQSFLEDPSSSPDTLVLELARELASAVALFHAKRVLINNIRPVNIRVVVSEERVEVRFFRLTHTTAGRGYRHKQGQRQLARYRYLAPEVRMRTATTSSSSDIYSLGVIFADLLASSLDPKVKEIVKACLAPVPQDRPTALNLVLMFDAVLASEDMP